MSLTMTATMNVTFQEMATAIAVLCCPDSEHSQRIILCCPDSEHTKGCQHRDGTVMFKTGMEGGPRSAPEPFPLPSLPGDGRGGIMSGEWRRSRKATFLQSLVLSWW